MKKLLHEYTDKLHELETLDGYTIHHKTEEVLQGLGFRQRRPATPLPRIQRRLAHARTAGKNDPAAARPAAAG